MASEKTGRNKTINTSVSEGTIYLNRCISVNGRQDSLENVLDKTILGDTFHVCPLLPRDSVDLIIADPPYNLTKSFHNTTFSRKKESDYEEYKTMAGCSQAAVERYRFNLCLLRLGNKPYYRQSTGRVFLCEEPHYMAA